MGILWFNNNISMMRKLKKPYFVFDKNNELVDVILSKKDICLFNKKDFILTKNIYHRIEKETDKKARDYNTNYFECEQVECDADYEKYIDHRKKNPLSIIKEKYKEKRLIDIDIEKRTTYNNTLKNNYPFININSNSRELKIYHNSLKKNTFFLGNICNETNNLKLCYWDSEKSLFVNFIFEETTCKYRKLSIHNSLNLFNENTFIAKKILSIKRVRNILNRFVNEYIIPLNELIDGWYLIETSDRNFGYYSKNENIFYILSKNKDEFILEKREYYNKKDINSIIPILYLSQ